MRKFTTIEELMNELENNGYFGLRGATKRDMELIENGRNYLDVSYNVSDGVVDLDCPFNGTCAIGINDYMDADEIKKRLENVKDYLTETETILLIKDSRVEYGNDDNEVILGHDGYGADIVAVVEI